MITQGALGMDWRVWVSLDPRVCHGRACCAGTRIPLTVVLDNLAEGATSEDLLRQYPGLRPEHVQAALAYASELARERVLPLDVAG